MASAPVGRFSGGEKARLTLALLVREQPNLLLLDEPTNHLDIEMREALAEALQDYDGALIVVAHDRHLLRATTDALWLVADGRVAPFDGDLDDYRDWVLGLRSRARSRRPRARRGRRTAADRQAQKRAEAEARQKTYAQRKPLADRLGRVESGDGRARRARRRPSRTGCRCPTPTPTTTARRSRPRVARQGDLAWQLARLETEWLELSEALEGLAAG